MKLPASDQVAALANQVSLDPFRIQQDRQGIELLFAIRSREDYSLADRAPVVAASFVRIGPQGDHSIAVARQGREVAIIRIGAANNCAPMQADHLDLGKPFGCLGNLRSRRNESLTVTKNRLDQLKTSGCVRRTFPSRQL